MRSCRFLCLLLFSGAVFQQVVGENCTICYYKRQFGQPYVYQVSSCFGAACSLNNRGKKNPLEYPPDSKIGKICYKNECSITDCTLPGGPCKQDNDCCNPSTIPKFYPKGTYSNVSGDSIKLTDSSEPVCIQGTCQLDKYRNGSSTSVSQMCYFQDPTISKPYLVYSLQTCNFCPFGNGKRDDEHLTVLTGLPTQNGLVLRKVNGKCAYCSIIGGKCSTTADCCAGGYNSYVEKVSHGSLNAYDTPIDKVKCSGGKCVIDSCFKHNDECIYGSTKKCCLATDVCVPSPSTGVCKDKGEVPPVDCPGKKGLVGCRGYTSGLIYCNCTFPEPEKCLANGQCAACSVTGQPCKNKNECCSVIDYCIGNKCSKCAMSDGYASCGNLPCCTGTCKMIMGKGGYDQRCE